MEKKKEIDDNAAKDIRSIFRLKAFKNAEEKNYWKPLTVDKFWNIIYIGYESNGDRNKPVSFEETSVRRIDFIFDCVYLFYYKSHKIKPNHAGSYRDCLDWIKNKKTTINLISKKDNEYFQYGLNHEKILKEEQK